MKKIVASVGLVALGASTVHAAMPAFLVDPAKPWNVSATLRGFYDDNINTAPDHANLGPGNSRESFGYEISPSITFGIPIPQGALSLGYTLSYKYYENKPAGSDGHDDLSHTFDLSLDHAFNERYSVAVRDSFVIGQEPDLLRTGNAMTTYQRVPGDNIRNFGTIDFRGQITQLLGFEVGYANSYYDYKSDTPGIDFSGNFVPSLSGLLDRLEHVIHLDGRWTLQPETTLILGYQYREIDYTGDQIIGTDVNGNDVFSKDRNSRMHYGYVGADHTFRPDLSGSVRVGAQWTDYYNDPNTDSEISPYALASLRWTYLPESFLEVGVTHDRNATDVSSFGSNGVTTDAESTVVFASVTHKITPKLYGSLLGQYQNSAFHGGPADSETENFYMAGVNLEYRFTPNFSAHVGYNYDKLESDVPNRSMDRNRVYLGITARY